MEVLLPKPYLNWLHQLIKQFSLMAMTKIMHNEPIWQKECIQLIVDGNVIIIYCWDCKSKSGSKSIFLVFE